MKAPQVKPEVRREMPKSITSKSYTELLEDRFDQVRIVAIAINEYQRRQYEKMRAAAESQDSISGSDYLAKLSEVKITINDQELLEIIVEMMNIDRKDIGKLHFASEADREKFERLRGEAVAAGDPEIFEEKQREAHGLRVTTPLDELLENFVNSAMQDDAMLIRTMDRLYA